MCRLDDALQAGGVKYRPQMAMKHLIALDPLNIPGHPPLHSARFSPKRDATSTHELEISIPRHSMYVIFTYIGVVPEGSMGRQSYGSPMERLGYIIHTSIALKKHNERVAESNQSNRKPRRPFVVTQLKSSALQVLRHVCGVPPAGRVSPGGH